MKKLLPHLKSIFAGLLAIAALNNADAHNYSYSAKKTGTAISTSGTQLIIKDADFPGGTTYNANWINAKNIQVQNSYGVVKLDIANGSGLINYKFEVKVAVTAYMANGASIAEEHWLTVEYNNNLGKQPADRSAVKFQGAHELRVTIKEIKVNGVPRSYNNVFPLLELSATIEVERSYKLGALASWTFSATRNGDFIDVSWATFPGAEEYDLEWTFVNRLYNSNANTPGTPTTIAEYASSQVSYDFTSNATRVRVSNLDGGFGYKIPALFESGFVMFRIRPVTYRKLGKVGAVTGAWNGSLAKGLVSSYSPQVAIVTFSAFSTAHEKGLNWIHQATYAEEGKRKDVMTYADGLSKPRQAVTYLPSKKESVVKETVYDEFGRPIVETLPTPTAVDGIKFFRNFYRSSTTSGPLSFTDFIGTAGCNSGSSPIVGGPDAIYYATRAGKDELDKYVPHAGGYAYTQQEYTPDRTGRVTAQTLPGDSFRLGSGRETRMIYGQPTQQELDRLFGNDVGVFSHYKKTLQIDQNGQKSVTYIDMMGKTIATALVDANPASLAPIPSNPVRTGEAAISADMLANVRIDDELLSEKTILSTKEADYSFTYNLNPTSFAPQACNGAYPVCLDCDYELLITIEDECGNQPPLQGGLSWPLGIDLSAHNSMACSGTTTPYQLPFVARLGVGSYKLIKSLRVSRDSLESHFEDYLLGDTCLKSFNDFVEEELATVDITECDPKDCTEDCADLLTGSTVSPYYNCLINANCAGSDDCSGKRDKMLADVSPGGQYAGYGIDTQGAYTTSDSTVSLLNITGTNALGVNYKSVSNYLDDAGNPALVLNSSGVAVNPSQLSVSEFITNWKSSWSAALLPLHPEYGCLQKCQGVPPIVNSYEDLLFAVDNYKDALALNLLDPLDMNPVFLNNTGNDPVSGLQKDPFFQTGYGGSGYNSSLQSKMLSSTFGTAPNQVNLSIWEAAAVMANCEGSTTNTDLTNCINYVKTHMSEFYPTNPDECFDGLVWDYFRALYLAHRQDYYRQWFYSGTCPGTVYPQGNAKYGRKQYFVHEAELMEQQFPGIDADGNPMTYANANHQDVDIESNCENVCNEYKSFWLDRLAGCFSQSTTALQKQNLANDLALLCKEGCDVDNQLGSSSLPTGTTIIANGIACSNFQQVLEAHGFNPTLVCSASLIDNPMPYGHEYSGIEESTLVDSCACNTVMNAKLAYQNATNLPSHIQSFDDYMVFYHKIDQPTVGRLECGCRDAFEELTGNTWTSGAQWTIPANTDYLAVLRRFVGPVPVVRDLGCTPCISCNAFEEAVEEIDSLLLNVYGFDPQNTPDSLRDEAYQILLTQLSGKLGTDFTREDLDYFTVTCKTFNSVTSSGSTGNQGDTTIVITDEDKELIFDYTKFWNFLTQRTDVLDEACLCIQPYTDEANISTSYYSPTIGNLTEPGYDPFNCGHRYQFTGITQNKLTGYITDGTGQDCQVSLEFKEPQSSLKIQNVSYIRDLRPYATGTGDVHHFLATAVVMTSGGTTTEVQVIGYNSCIVFGKAHLVSDPDFRDDCLKKPRPESTEDNCYNSIMERVTYTASLRYSEYRDSLRNDFVVKYKTKCLTVTEKLTSDYTSGEHHYTLYYYDQAGNLIKTIPPEGVEVITSTALLNQVAQHRAGSGAAYRPPHRMATGYRYNSLGQVTEQYMPDHVAFKNALGSYFLNSEFSARFWYDAVGRVVLSQNTRQFSMNPPRYSYTVYDKLGRVVESGELPSNATTISSLDVRNASFPNNLATTRYEVSKTYYDLGNFSGVTSQFSGGQQNLRNRVSASVYYPVWTEGTTHKTDYSHATHYSYDIHGNVKALVQDFDPLMAVGRFKKIEYSYDLISGKVNQVAYQRGRLDALFHKYAYDEDNRITQVETSRDGVLWNRDAAYSYYRHGPLGRTVIGQKQVQGIDYAYTLQGWLKAINGKDQLRLNDMGRDGDPKQGSQVADDAFSMMLTYYGDLPAATADYKPVDNCFDIQSKFTGLSPQTGFSGSLYNGNIKGITLGFCDSLKIMASPAPGLPPVQGEIPTAHYAYRYDQLNRLIGMNAGLGSSAITTVSTDRYATSYVYDANGNIDTLRRNGNYITSALMDSLVYSYPNTAGKRTGNRLLKVSEGQTDKTLYDNDFENGGSGASLGAFNYDNIGNLTADKNDSIANITWDSRGKITSVTTSKLYGSDLEFAYDAQGNRTMKIVKPRIGGVKTNEEEWDYTCYVRDAQGNIMATNNLDIAPTTTAGKYKETLSLQELDLYGSSRLGTVQPINGILGSSEFTSGPADATGRYERNTTTSVAIVYELEPMTLGKPLSHLMGYKKYEVANHLGNVMAVVTDRKITVSTPVAVFANDPISLCPSSSGSVLLPGATSYRSFIPEFVSAQDYYPFGSLMPGRQFNSASYRFGFNGQEKDDEIAGTANSYTAEYWQYSSRLARRWNVDPVLKGWESPYACFSNNPIFFIDPHGDNAGDYYKTDGTYLGSDGIDDDKAYTADEMTTTKGADGKDVNTFTNAKELNIKHSELVNQAATIYGESSAYAASKVTDDLKNEMKAIAGVHQVNKIAYGANSAKAKEYKNLSLSERSKSPFKRAATEAVIYAVQGGSDMSNGATMWDGQEQSLYDATENAFSKDGFELHMNTMGWSISKDLYDTWKANVGTNFKAPQEKAAPGNYKNYTNSGKKRLEATAVYGKTIFWKVVD